MAKALYRRAFPEGDTMQSFTANQVRLGFIGVGAMGSRLVRRLLAHGFNVNVYDQNPSNAKALRGDGAFVASTPAEVADRADVILSCLTNDAAVRDVYLDAAGVFSATRPGQSVLEMSTISPRTSREVY